MNPLLPYILHIPPYLISFTDFFLIDGFFDSGMLMSALKAKEEVEPLDRSEVLRRNIGRRLKLVDY